MRPDVWILVFNLTVTAYLATALPDDWKPKLFKDKPESAPVFTGEGSNGGFRELIDLQEVKLIGNERAIITARNNIFVLDLKEVEDGGAEIKFSQVVEWEPSNATTCKYKTADASRCNNFIRVSAKMSENRFLICGTNARIPKCREYEWDGRRFTDYFEGQDCFGERVCLLDDVPSLAYLYSGGNLYLATKVGYRRDPMLRRTPLDGRLPGAKLGEEATTGATVNRALTMPNLATDYNNPSMLNDPVFVSAMETTEKVFVFFRETAVEQFGNGKETFSRVTQVCKNDRGGTDTFRSHKWTSYFKARLSCFVPGGRPFHFDELRHVTRAFVIDGVTTLFAAMTTPTNSIWGSAVCAYTVPAIEKAMNGDFLKRPSYDGSSTCWSKHSQRAPDYDKHPTQCASVDGDTRNLEKEALRFRLHHPLMHDTVQPITGQPLFVRTQARYLFTAIDAETDVATDADGRNVTILYIGTSDGRLLKVVPRPFDVAGKQDSNEPRANGAFVEEIVAYDPQKCVRQPTGRSVFPETEKPEELNDAEGEENPERVLSVTAVKGRNVLLVAFRTCVVSVPKQLCSQMQYRKACVQSGNPYCGWMDGSCVAVTEELRPHVEQDLFSERNDFVSYTSERKSTSTFSSYIEETRSDEKSPCPSATSLAVPIVISLAASFALTLSVFFVVVKCKKGSRARTKDQRHMQSSLEREQSYSKRNASWDERHGKPIYNGPKRSASASTGSFSGSRPPSFVGQPGHVGCRAGESSDTATLDETQPCGYASMDSLKGSFSRSSSGSIRASDSAPRNAARRVQVIEGVKGGGRLPPGGAGELDPNLNNNNLKKNIGIAYALSRADSPMRRRTFASHDKSELQMPAASEIRMGLAWGASAGGTPQRQPPSWKPKNLQGQNVMTVAPMPANSNTTTQQTQEERTSLPETPGNAQSRRSDGMLPKPPATGLTAGVSAKFPRIVSGYNEVENSQNRTFRRGASASEAYYSETPPEPEYENTKHQRKASTPGDFARKSPTPLPHNVKPGRKFSSFTASHFNTSWFPAPALQESPGDLATRDDRGKYGNCGGCTSSSAVSSNSTVSDSRDPTAEGPYMEPYTLDRNASLKRGPTKFQPEHSAASRPSTRSADEGYGSELVSSEDKRNHSNESSQSDNIHIYNNISNEDLPFFSGLARSPDEENIIKDLDNAEWSGNQGSRTKTLKKKKTGKKKKGATEKRTLVPDLSSPSDSENVFADGALTMGSNYANEMYRIYHEEHGVNYSLPSGQTLDDSFVDCGSRTLENEDSSAAGDNQYAFNTMRPPGRMRQKLPRLRCGPKETEATLRAVPTPEIPKF